MDNNPTPQQTPSSPLSQSAGSFEHTIQPVEYSSAEVASPNLQSKGGNTAKPYTYESFSSTRINQSNVSPSSSPNFTRTNLVDTKQNSSNVLANIFIIIYGLLQLGGSIFAIMYASRSAAPLGAIYTFFGGIGIVFAILFLLRLNIARIIVIVLQIPLLFNNMYSLISYISRMSTSSYLYPAIGLIGYTVSILIGIAVIFFMTRPSVKALFR